MDASLEVYAVCPAGFERIVSEELKSQGIKRIRPLKGGVAFFGTIEDALKACLWLRSASRVLLVLARIGCASADELYEQTRAIPWQEHIGPDATIAVSAHGTNRELRNTQFSAMRVKDAICDELRAQTGTRPKVLSTARMCRSTCRSMRRRLRSRSILQANRFTSVGIAKKGRTSKRRSRKLWQQEYC